jgi:hypothetical protein
VPAGETVSVRARSGGSAPVAVRAVPAPTGAGSAVSSGAVDPDAGGEGSDGPEEGAALGSGSASERVGVGSDVDGAGLVSGGAEVSGGG